MNRRRDILGLVWVSLVFALGFFTLYSNQSDYFCTIEKAYKSGDALNLSPDMSSGELARFLLDKSYLDDPKDAKIIADSIIIKMDGKPLPNLGSLNKPEFQISALIADSLGGSSLKSRVANSRKNIGYDDIVQNYYSQNTLIKSIKIGNQKIEVQIIDNDSKKPAQGVLVRLKEHYYKDSLDYLNNLASRVAEDSIVGYSMTNSDGIATFEIDATHYYSVLPIKYGYEYGRSKGTLNGKPINGPLCFIQKKHKITLFDALTYSRIKQDQRLTVRTPTQYKDNLIFAFVMFLTVWWLLYFLVLYCDKRLQKLSDHLLIVILMALTGIGLLSIFSISHPLLDMENGSNVMQGIILGGLALVICSSFNYIKFFNDNSFIKFDYIGQKIPWLKGISYVLLALLFVFSVFKWGYAPEGSDARVNLDLPGFTFQPSEISKYLIVFFVASFFTINANRIQAFSENLTRNNFFSQLKTVSLFAVVILVMLGLYVVALSDMGPALVLLVTFILLYSIARKDTIPLFIGVITFIMILLLGRSLNNTANTMLLFAFVWFLVWIIGCLIHSKKLYESAIFMNLVILAFVIGGDILTQMGMHQGQRLLNRVAMSGSGVWMNDAPGGDQIAQGIWSLSTGGFFGQGLGRGNSNLVPACTTDMILSSIGETMGWITLVLILICLAVLLHRCLLLARRAGHPFAFFLLSGIALVTGVQFFVITMGSLGLIPLTGVAVPFLSYGKSSLIINMAAFGVVVSLSRIHATNNQKEDIRKYDNVVAMGSAAFLTLSAVIVGTLFYYQIWERNNYIIKPVYITNTEGAFVEEQNPRISILMHQLHAGNIYDRNGLLLATSSVDSLKNVQRQLCEEGVDEEYIKKLVQKRLQRYYPFGNHTLFMLGDFNTGVIRDQSVIYPRGYVAEYRHLAELRGFENTVKDKSGNIVKIKFESKHFRESTYLPMTKSEFVITQRDYSTLLPLLKSGNDSKMVREWNEKRKSRDLQMTIDAKLQMVLENTMASHISKDVKLNTLRKFRASVVILNASTGELLCSANYPQPNQDTIRLYPQYTEKNPSQWAWTTQDLGTTYLTQPGSTAKIMSAMAAFRKYGKDASLIKYYIHDQEIIEAKGKEPSSRDVNMRDAIKLSSNIYFVNLVHDKQLYPELNIIYQTFGIQVNNGQERNREAVIPYYFYMFDNVGDSVEYRKEINHLANFAYQRYNNYQKRVKRTSADYEKMRWPECGVAWGQHHINASPLDMVRVAATVSNNGLFVPTSFIMNEKMTPIQLISSECADILKEYMQDESTKHRNKGQNLPAGMGGKTGTPNRDMGRKYQNINDGWYICFTEARNDKPSLAIAVRLERIGLAGMNSGRAVQFVANTVLPVLRDLNYISE